MGMDRIDGMLPRHEEVDAVCMDCQGVYAATVAWVAGRPMAPLRPRCPACAEVQRAQKEAEDHEAEVAARDERFMKRCARNFAELAVPKSFTGVRVNVFVPWGSAAQQAKVGRAAQIAHRIIGDITGGFAPLPFVAFLGRPGTGKTLLAWAIAADLTQVFGHTAKVVRLAALVRDIRGAWNNKTGPSEDERLAKYLTPDYLAIDEVSRHAFYGQQIHQHLYDVINSRLEDEKITVLTSNESEAGLEEILGPALMSRLRLGGIVDFGDEDFRAREWAA